MRNKHGKDCVRCFFNVHGKTAQFIFDLRTFVANCQKKSTKREVERQNERVWCFDQVTVFNKHISDVQMREEMTGLR